MAEPLVSPVATVRELHPADAELIAAEAARGVPIVRGRIAVPGSAGEALAQLSDFQALREKDRATIVGAFDSQTNELTGVLSLYLDEDFVAEGACWNQDQHERRLVTAQAVNLLTQYAHGSMGIVRVWVDVDPLDHFGKFLKTKCGYQLEAQLRPPRGAAKDRYSSVG